MTPRPFLLALLCLAACLGACTSQREHRAGLRALDETWDAALLEDDYPTMLEHVRGLADGDPEEPGTLVSIAALSRLVVSPGGATLTSSGGRIEEWRFPGFLRAEALRSAWRAAAPLEPRPYVADTMTQSEFNATSLRFEELAALGATAAEPEFAQLVDTLGATRLAVGKPGLRPDLASSLAELVASQAAWGPSEETRAAFAPHAEASVLHALSGVTLLAARDADAFLREEAVRAAQHMHPDDAWRLLEDTLAADPAGEVRRAALVSLRLQAERHPGPRWRELLDLIGPLDSRPLRDEAAALRRSLP